jgi:NAD(P)-dependent dehydrogenase (short-subunit alcohol dehydrogenase family)
MKEEDQNKKLQPKQSQMEQPGIESKMQPKPEFEDINYKGSNKLKDKVAIITGGDSGIGRAVAIAFAKEEADVVITFLDEIKDAEETKKIIESKGKKCLTIAGDVGDSSFCDKVIKDTLKEFGKIDILVNNAGEQHVAKEFEKITDEQLKRTFATNIFGYFYMIRAALPHLKKGATIVNTASVTAYKGNEKLIDYSSTKGAIVSLVCSLSQQIVKDGIRINGVAPGPVWTPLIPASFSPKEVEEFGSQVPMKRAGQPREIAPCYVFLASDDSSYMTGQILHPNGGVIVNS